MRRFWRRDRSLSELEGELRARRADPPKAFLSALADRARVDQRSLRPSFRLSPVYGVALIAVVALVVAGGAGLVQSGSSGASRLFDRLASSSSPTNVSGSSGDDQYEDVCGSAPRKKRCVITIDDESVTEPQSGCVIADFIVSLATRSDQTVRLRLPNRDRHVRPRPDSEDDQYPGVPRREVVEFRGAVLRGSIRPIPECHDREDPGDRDDLSGQGRRRRR